VFTFFFLRFLKPSESATFDYYEQIVFDPAQTVQVVGRAQEAHLSPRSHSQKLSTRQFYSLNRAEGNREAQPE